MGQVVPLGHIQHERTGGATVATNQVASMLHIKRQRPGDVKMEPNQIRLIWRIRCRSPGDTKIAFAITTRTTSIIRRYQVGIFIRNLHKWVYINFVNRTSLIWLLNYTDYWIIFYLTAELLAECGLQHNFLLDF